MTANLPSRQTPVHGLRGFAGFLALVMIWSVVCAMAIGQSPNIPVAVVIVLVISVAGIVSEVLAR